MPRFSSRSLRRDLSTTVSLAVPLFVLLAPGAARADDVVAPPPPPSASTAPAASTTPAAATPASPPAAAAAPPAAAPTVELSANDGRATIERRVGTASPGGMPLFETGLFTVGQWEHQCIAPCAVKLDPKYAYRVGGDGLVPTDSFALPHSGDRIRVDAKMGSSTGRTAGAVATAGGAGLIALGGLALILTPIFASEDVGSEGLRTGMAVGGISAVSVGVLAVGAGLYLWFANGSSARTEVAPQPSVASR